MKRPSFTTYLALPSQKIHFSHLKNRNNIFYYKNYNIPMAIFYTMVTPMVVPNLDKLALTIQWLGPCAYALKSMQVHTR